MKRALLILACFACILSSCKNSDDTDFHFWYSPSIAENKVKNGIVFIKNDANEFAVYDDEMDYEETFGTFFIASETAKALSEELLEGIEVYDPNNPPKEFVDNLVVLNRCLKYVEELPIEDEKLEEYGIPKNLYKIMEKVRYDCKDIEFEYKKAGYGYSVYTVKLPFLGDYIDIDYKFGKYEDEKDNMMLYNNDIIPDEALTFDIYFSLF